MGDAFDGPPPLGWKCDRRQIWDARSPGWGLSAEWGLEALGVALALDLGIARNGRYQRFKDSIRIAAERPDNHDELNQVHSPHAALHVGDELLRSPEPSGEFDLAHPLLLAKCADSPDD